MLVNLTFNDPTHKKIIKEIEETQKLISRVATKLSNCNKECNIYLMPDLGIASNITRMCGGMFTGACYTWKTDVKFIPVDATVNVCGTAVYKLKHKIEINDFKRRTEKVLINKSKYDWNYDSGNHFITLTESTGEYGLEKGQYLVVHASAKEYKKENMTEGLYPVKGNWFYDDIETEYDKETGRYLRYIKGEKADRFYKIAQFLKQFNKDRNKYFGQQVLGDLLECEIVNISHYGMPTQNSICIGTQWENEMYTLLTAPGNNIYLVDPILKKGNKNLFIHDGLEILLSPHGLGLQLVNENDNIQYTNRGMKIGEKEFLLDESVNIDIDVKIRTSGESKEKVKSKIKEVLEICPGNIKGELKQICSLTKRGFEVFQ